MADFFQSLLNRVANPFDVVVSQVCPECGPLWILLKVLIIAALLWITDRYFTKNKTALALVAIVAFYFLFL